MTKKDETIAVNKNDIVHIKNSLFKAEKWQDKIDVHLKGLNSKTAKHASWIKNFDDEEYKKTIKGNRTFNIKIGTAITLASLLISTSGVFILRSVADAYFAEKEVEMHEETMKAVELLLADYEFIITE